MKAAEQERYVGKKYWKLQPPEGYYADGDTSKGWQAEQVPFVQGVKQCPYLALTGYLVLLVLSLWFHIYAYINLPESFTLATWFELGESSFSKGGFLLVSFGLLVYFIYRDLIHKSMSQFLLVIPAIYFVGSYFLISSLL